MSTHPRLIRALEAKDYRALFVMALHSRSAMEEGRYCEGETPELAGNALMCGACLLHNKDQERAAVDRIVRAHKFVPGQLEGLMCAVCTNGENAQRHHGVSAVGKTSWGEERRPT